MKEIKRVAIDAALDVNAYPLKTKKSQKLKEKILFYRFGGFRACSLIHPDSDIDRDLSVSSCGDFATQMKWLRRRRKKKKNRTFCFICFSVFVQQLCGQLLWYTMSIGWPMIYFVFPFFFNFFCLGKEKYFFLCHTETFFRTRLWHLYLLSVKTKKKKQTIILKIIAVFFSPFFLNPFFFVVYIAVCITVLCIHLYYLYSWFNLYMHGLGCYI